MSFSCMTPISPLPAGEAGKLTNLSRTASEIQFQIFVIPKIEFLLWNKKTLVEKLPLIYSIFLGRCSLK